jgi:glycosyltransferase involved in cell wall biosynthesis
MFGRECEMHGGDILVSVILTANGNPARIRETLRALSHQDRSAPAEFILVERSSGNGTDDFGELGAAAPAGLKIVDGPAATPAAAWNTGAAAARGRYLIFLDSALVPADGFVEEHVKTLRSNSDTLSIGYVRMAWLDPGDLMNITGRIELEKRYAAMRRPHHRFCLEDLFEMNFACSADHFERMGGFDASLDGKELQEFAYRWIRSGRPVAYSPLAQALRLHTVAFRQELSRQFRNGLGNAQLCGKHPELYTVLGMWNVKRFCKPRKKFYFLVALVSSPYLRWAHGPAHLMLGCFERLKMRKSWAKHFRLLCMIEYCRGYRRAFPSFASMMRRPDYSGIPHSGQGLRIDLKDGWKAALERVDRERPDGIILEYHRHPMVRIPSRPGAEPLRGIHLHALLAESPPRELVMMTALEALENVGERAHDSGLTPVAPKPQKSSPLRGAVSGQTRLAVLRSKTR